MNLISKIGINTIYRYQIWKNTARNVEKKRVKIETQDEN